MVSPHDVDAMAERVSDCPWWPTFDADAQALIQAADLYVEDRPSELELELTGTDLDHTLLGVTILPDTAVEYGLGDRTISKVFYEPHIELGRDPCDTMLHEIGHLPGMDFPHHDEDDCRMCSRPQERRMTARPFSDDCPVCNTFSRLSEARGLLDYLRFQSHLTHRVPIGLGGTIPLADWRAGQAYDQLNIAFQRGLLRGREDAAEELAGLILRTRQALQGELTVEDVSIADDLCNQAWAYAGDVNWWYWAHASHPEMTWAS